MHKINDNKPCMLPHHLCQCTRGNLWCNLANLTGTQTGLADFVWSHLAPLPGMCLGIEHTTSQPLRAYQDNNKQLCSLNKKNQPQSLGICCVAYKLFFRQLSHIKKYQSYQFVLIYKFGVLFVNNFSRHLNHLAIFCRIKWFLNYLHDSAKFYQIILPNFVLSVKSFII